MAMSEEKLSADSPVMVWPEVQPFAYRVPKPTQNPPITIIKNPLSENNVVKLNTCEGTSPLTSESPMLFRSEMVFSLSATGFGFLKTYPARNPPSKMPAT